MKTENNTVVISNIVSRGYSQKEKVEAVKLLVNTTKQKETSLIDNGNLNTKRYLNKIRLRLNAHGKSIFVRNLKNVFKDLIDGVSGITEIK